MSRKAPIITLEELKSKCEILLNIGHPDFEWYNNFTPKIKKDLEKINFDFENLTFGGEGYYDEGSFADYPAGYKVLDNNLPILLSNAGGDWEHPICYCIYWDGKEMRAYIPKDGNVYNKKEKCAYGSEDDCDYNEITEESNHELIFADIMKRIQIS